MSVANPIQGYSLGVVILGGAVQDTPVVNTTEFFGPFGRAALNSSETARELVMPRGMTLHSFIVEHNNAQAVTVMVVTIRIAGADTAITVDVPIGTAGVVQDLVNRAHINAGEILSVSFASQAGATNAFIDSFSFLGDLDG